MRDRLSSELIDTPELSLEFSQVARARTIVPNTIRPTPAARLSRWPSGSSF